VAGGHVRVDGTRVSKPSYSLTPGLTLTFPQAKQIRVIRVELLATRRGPAAEAMTLYSDLTPPPQNDLPPNPRFDGKGRPGRKDRRNARLSGPDPLD
jgi:ribosome-associated heat shock protein Hsp15